jgi:hypothetical protein
MRSSQKAGGVATVVDAAAFVVGFVVAAALIAPEGYDVADVDDPVGSAEFLADNQAVMYVWNLIIYVVFGLFLVVLVPALYDRLKAAEPLIARAAAAIGLAGLLTIVPALEAFGALFGLALIVWFIWVGSIMLKGAADGDSISEPMSRN